MVVLLTPEKKLDVFLMMVEVLSVFWTFRHQDIRISGIETSTDLDHLFNNGITLEYKKDAFLRKILAALGNKKFNFKVKYKVPHVPTRS